MIQFKMIVTPRWTTQMVGTVLLRWTIKVRRRVLGVAISQVTQGRCNYVYVHAALQIC